MLITKALLSINYRAGRPGSLPVDMIVIHVMEGTMSSTLSWFNDPESKVSSHYGISKYGDIVQYVDEADEAYANGRVDHPSAKLVIDRVGVNPNYYSISIEHEGTGLEDLTEPQKEASVWLIRDIASRYHIPINRTHIVGHHEIYSLKSCPGKIDVDALVAEAAVVEPIYAPTNQPQVVWSNWFKDWLVVTKFVSDDEWYFIQAKTLEHLAPEKAGTKLSMMPRNPVE